MSKVGVVRGALLGASLPVVLSLLSGCGLPGRRPEAELSVRECYGEQVPGTVSHGKCLVLDASGSSVGASDGGFTWTAELASTTSGGVSVTVPLAGDPALVGTTAAGIGTACAVDGPVICGRFFQDFLVDGNVAGISVRVTDREGRDRRVEVSLGLTNDLPELVLQDTPVKPRSLEIYFNPFIVIRPEAVDPDGDALRFSVRQITGPSEAPMARFRCADVANIPGLAGYADPAPDSPEAICFLIDVRDDDPATPEVEGAAIRSSEPTDLTFRVKVFERFGAGDGLDETDATNCESRAPGSAPAERVGCVRVRFEDTVWVASGHGLSGRIGRVSADWRRRLQPGEINVRDGRGMTTLEEHVLMAGVVGECDGSQCEGGVVGVSPGMQMLSARGLGAVEAIEAQNAGGPGATGVWLYMLATNSAGNPGAVQVPRFGPAFDGGDPVIAPYLAYFPSSSLDALTEGVTTDLRTAALPGIRIVSGFTVIGDPVLGDLVEYPLDIHPAPNGALWVSTVARCRHYDAATSACTADTTAPAGYDFHLRVVPPGTGDVDIQTVTDVPHPFLVNTIIPDASNLIATASPAGDVWVVDSEDGIIFNRARRLSADGTVMLDDGFGFFGAPTAIAYDAALDVLWIADALEAAVYRVESPGQLDVITDLVVPRFGPFTRIPSLALDLDGGLWIDDHPDNGSRVTSYIPPLDVGAAPDSLAPVILDEFTSFGYGVTPSVRSATPGVSDDLSRGAWRPDITDVVRIPLRSPEEVVAMASGPVYSTLAGVDPTDGAAYVYAPSTGPNVFRVGAYGEITPVLQLPGVPLCGTLVPEIPRAIVSSNGGGIVRGSMWLCEMSEGDSLRLVEIELRHLRRIALGAVPQPVGDLEPCPAGTPGDAPGLPCWKSIIEQGTGPGMIPPAIFPKQMVLSLFEAQLYVHYATSANCGSDGMFTVFLSRVIDESLSPAVTNDVPFTLANRPRCESRTAALSAFAANDFTAGGEGRLAGGVWVAQEDGVLQRWKTDDAGNLLPDPGVRVDLLALEPNLRAVTSATDIYGDEVTVRLWVSFDDLTGGPTSIRQYELVLQDGVMALAQKGDSIAVPTTARAMAAAPFANSVWASGDDGFLVRLHAIDGTGGADDVLLEYVRLPDYFGTIGPTPAGKSMSLGGF